MTSAKMKRLRLTFAAAWLAAVPGIFPSALFAAEASRVKPDSALELLVEGNKRFVAGKAIRPDQGVARRAELAKGQQPFAIVLTCADSRVAPEIYFDQGLGSIFVIRNAGNVLDDHVIGSIEYAVEHLGAALIVVVGHSKCGAVAATVAGGHAPGHLPSIVESIAPAVKRSAGEPGDKVDNAVRANAQLVAAQLRECGPILNEAVGHGKLQVVAARYDLASGKVQVLPALADGPQSGTVEPAPEPHAQEARAPAHGH